MRKMPLGIKIALGVLGGPIGLAVVGGAITTEKLCDIWDMTTEFEVQADAIKQKMNESAFVKH